jgi:hypothetical protein
MAGDVDWRVSTAFGHVEIELHPGDPDLEGREHSVQELTRLLYDFKYGQPEARRAVLAAYARLQGLPSVAVRDEALAFDEGSVRAEAIAAELLHAVKAGTLVLRRKETRGVVVPLPGLGDAEEVLGPLSESEAETTWIAIELVGEDGKPIPAVPYRITLPDGSTREGTLDSGGRAMIRGIDPGQCGVTFPLLDQNTWGLAGG